MLDLSLLMHETAIFPLPVLHLTSASCSSTPISSNTRNFRQFDRNKGYIAHFSLRMRETAVISTSGLKSDATIDRFPERRENFGDSRTFEADIGLLNICMGFQDLGLKWGLGGTK